MGIQDLTMETNNIPELAKKSKSHIITKIHIGGAGLRWHGKKKYQGFGTLRLKGCLSLPYNLTDKSNLLSAQG